jgi:hypothetical protein
MVLTFGLILFLVQKKLLRINFIYFLLSVQSYLAVILFRTCKVHIIISNYQRQKFYESLPLTSMSQLTGAFLPGRAGEILLSTLIKLKFQLDVSKFLPTLFVDKLLELFFVIFYSLISCFLFNGDILKQLINSIHLNLYTIVGCLIIFLIILSIFFKLKSKFNSYFKKIVENIISGILLPIRNPYLGYRLIFLNAITILIEFFYLYNVFRTFEIFNLEYSKVIIIHSIGMIIGIISMIPGGQGSTELSMLLVLTTWGFNPSSVLLPIVFSKILVYILLIILSIPVLPQAIFLLKERKNRKKEMPS